MTDYVVGAGVVSSGITLFGGDTLTVLSGGTAVDSVLSGGEATIVSGGVASGTTVLEGAQEIISTGGTAISAIVSSGGAEDVLSGGIDSSVHVLSGGTLDVSHDSVLSAPVFSGGNEVIEVSVSVGNVVLAPSGLETLTLGDGATAADITISSGGTLIVDRFAAASGTVINSGGMEIVSAGAEGGGHVLAGGALILSSGSVQIGQGQSVSGLDLRNAGSIDSLVQSAITVDQGGLLVISGFGGLDVTSGATATDMTFGSGQTLDVGSGGVASDTTIASGGGLTVESGGQAIQAVVTSGSVSISGVAVGMVIKDSYVEINTGGVTTGTSLSGGTEFIDGVTSGTILAAGSIEYVDLGTASGTLISSGGKEVVYGGAAEAGAHVLSGGMLILSGGAVELDEGQSVSGLDLGNAARVSSFVSSIVDVDSGGTLEISSRAGLGVGTGATATATRVTGNLLIAEAGGVTTGSLVGSGGLEYVRNDGIAIGTIVNSVGAQVVDSGGLAIGTIIGSGGEADIESGGTVSGTVVSAGGDEVISGGTALGTTVSSGGAQAVLFGGIAAGTIISSGGVQGVGDSRFPLPIASIADGSIVESGGTLYVDSYGIAADTVLHVGGTIDVVGFTYVSGATATLDASTDVLTIVEGAQTHTLQLSGTYTNEFFHLAGDPSVFDTTTIITVDNVACYCRGTLILTERGDVAVEDLRIGDRLMTLSGVARPIRWIGRRSYHGRFLTGNRNALPVQFRPGSLADGVPQRDLFVSPHHAMFLDGMLVPAEILVNGASIIQVESADQVEYFHLELDAHDVILAEGAPSETFVDDGSRAMFHNASDYAALYPDAKDQPARYCAPRVEDGPALEALRRRLAARLEASVVAPGPLLGYIDGVDRGRITGWAKDAAGPVMLQVLNNGVVLGQVEANIHRADLVKAGIGDGRHAFDFAIPGGLSPFERHVIEVRRASDGQGLQQSPWVVEAQRRVA